MKMHLGVVFVGLTAATPANEGFAMVSEMSRQLSFVRSFEGVNNTLKDGDAVGKLIDTWQRHEYFVKQRSTDENIIQRFISVGKDLALKGIVQSTLSDEDRENIPLDSNEMFADYGCYCLPSQAYTADANWIGKGTPVDEIDTLCKKLLTCYGCIANSNNKCFATSPYSLKSTNDGALSCGNDASSCKGSLCQCDIDFASELAAVGSTWNKKFSKKFGFNRQKVCSSGKQPSLLSITSYNDPGSRSSVRDNTELDSVQCCGRGLRSVIYHSSRQECCKDGSTRAIGTCDF